jgi:hypothetical protein
MRDWLVPAGEGKGQSYTRGQARAAGGHIGQAGGSAQYQRQFDEENRLVAEKGEGERTFADVERDAN